MLECQLAGHHGGDLLIMKVMIVKVVMVLLMGVTFELD